MELPHIKQITQLAQQKPAGDRMFEKKKIRKVTDEAASVAGYLWDRGWAERNAGNMSVNITGLVTHGELSKLPAYPFLPLNRSYPALAKMVFLVTGAGTRMRDLSANSTENLCFIYISENGSAYHIISASDDTGNLKPTSEIATHLAIHQMLVQRKRPEKAILHTHATELIALTQIREMNSEEALNRIFHTMHPETVMYLREGCGYIPYTLPGTESLAQATVRNFENHRVVIWEKHGCMAIGNSISDALDNIDIIVKPAKIWFMVKNAGFEPEGMTDEQIRQLLE
jgi:rhamnulose-1-phosphate aldolase